MDDREELERQVRELQEKLIRTERRLAALRERSKLLRMQYDDSRQREQNTTEIINELLERQRELNVMLNRANIMLNRAQEAMALTSAELNEMAKSLPEPKKAEWEQRVAKINELFKKTGVQDAELIAIPSSTGNNFETIESDELKKESEQAFARDPSIWDINADRTPPQVEAFPVEEEEPSADQQNPPVQVVEVQSHEDAASQEPELESVMFPPRRKPWWRRAAGEG
ncbi:MAG: hypothetical protein QHI38_05760 [Armatimonadota bacterium]|nr:hypothetical protein [Armatimonadota bacterium]